MMESINQSPEEALRMIANGDQLPCRKCGEVHQPYQRSGEPKMAPQWHAPDGHLYYEMTPAEFAAEFLQALHNDGTIGERTDREP